MTDKVNIPQSSNRSPEPIEAILGDRHNNSKLKPEEFDELHVIYSIIIPAYNEAEELPATLASLRQAMAKQTCLGELIVVDNNSSDHTAQIAEANGADRVVREPINQIARARNCGARSSQGRYLIFVDADTRISAELLSEALRRLNTGYCAGGGAVVRFEGTVSTLGKVGISIWEYISKRTRTAAGSFLFCTRPSFTAIGGFDESLYASEEVRLSHQLKRWARTHRQSFEIITDIPARTSARKLEWYSAPQILGWVLLMLILPLAVRSRRFCGFWYKRPTAK